ncbi:putative Dol-P-Man:Man(7)GlcNAc(2)-PP-Dol alpha-1,6-mannosyltransferase [Auxenochlorella protothecoides]|uniref:Mannosyltransferase n=1 Tax=Auxenochlorella protothecoides TaxID=3075 RepID=A0A087SFR1_AUXPR|nr:putative Dol-P-Man:Man(7)GlcNAc(2)-PP-Dol alpha-1,6-mannosyltransferase [Auxenochlorella protothecoides]KFM24565.1 putative Dol-P-Man:Man(7)GlcNAc(2)-PP-Dol alpha-1,6-mannosyltransferase [Auxenochlorella protothecoides]
MGRKPGSSAPRSGEWRLRACSALLYVVVLAHIWLAPFTKVEESFNVQAMHDLWNHGADLEAYDHHLFPGVVPRTFLGAMSIVALASPALTALRLLQAPLLWQLYAVRACLGALSVASLHSIQSALAVRFGRLAALLFCLLTTVQFHTPFYASRPLPNVLACVLTNWGLAAWLGSTSPARVIGLFAAAVVIFRSDAALLAAPIGSHLLLSKQVTFPRAVSLAAGAALASLALTVAVDSLMWRRLVWPEGEVFAFNTWHNKSSEWGTQSWHWYCTSALPRALHGGFPLAALGATWDRRARPLLAVGLAFVGLYSFLPHKEARFLFPALPLFTACAAVALQRIPAQCTARKAREEGLPPKALAGRGYDYLLTDQAVVEGCVAVESVLGYDHLELARPLLLTRLPLRIALAAKVWIQKCTAL